MSPVIVSLLFTAGASTWLYTKFQRYSGNNTQQSAIATGFSALIIFIFFYYVLHLIVK